METEKTLKAFEKGHNKLYSSLNGAQRITKYHSCDPQTPFHEAGHDQL